MRAHVVDGRIAVPSAGVDCRLVGWRGFQVVQIVDAVQHHPHGHVRVVGVHHGPVVPLEAVTLVLVERVVGLHQAGPAAVGHHVAMLTPKISFF